MPAKRSCTDSEEPELVAQRESESLDLSPGVQVAVWLELGRTDTQREFWKGAVLVIMPVNQPASSQSKQMYKSFLR